MNIMFIDNSSKQYRKIIIGNLDCEEFWRDENVMRLPQLDFRNTKNVLLNLDELFIFLAEVDDVVILRNCPDKDYLNYLKNLNVSIPKIISMSSVSKVDNSFTTSKLIIQNEKLVEQLKHYVCENRKNGFQTYLFSYGVTQYEEILSELTDCKKISRSDYYRYFNNKLTMCEYIKDYNIPCPEYIICNNVDELESNGKEFLNKYSQIVIKEVFGSGGSGLAIIKEKFHFNRTIDLIRKYSTRPQVILLQKWQPHRLSYNYQYLLCDYGIFEFTNSTQIINNQGNIVGSIFDYSKQLRYIIESNQMIESIVHKIFDIGYRGIIGFDGIVYNEGIFPIIDLNCRINLSSIFHQIINKYFPCNYAIFFSREYYLNAPLNFNQLLEKLSIYAYSKIKNEGIIILNHQALNINVLNGNSNYGRVFYAVISSNEARANEIYRGFLNCCDEEKLL